MNWWPASSFNAIYPGRSPDSGRRIRRAQSGLGRPVGCQGGPAEISTAKGDIRIAEAVAGRVVLRTQAGNVSVGAAHGVSASLDAGTSYGRIQNTLKNSEGADAALKIHATTAYGDIVARSL